MITGHYSFYLVFWDMSSVQPGLQCKPINSISGQICHLSWLVRLRPLKLGVLKREVEVDSSEFACGFALTVVHVPVKRTCERVGGQAVH